MTKLSQVADSELVALFAALSASGRIILAVSGGADSMAMLVLAARWRDVTQSSAKLIAATVDHGLRAESKREAKAVASLSKALGVPHRVLAWRGVKPKTAIEAKARAARYALLGKLARAERATQIVTAHTLDDQAETVLMRLAAGSGPAGLGGVRAVEAGDGFTLLRPLLGTPKERLIATLRAAGVTWCEDPMNRDPAFARPRLRAARAALEAEGLTPERLARLAQRMQRAEAAIAMLTDAARPASPGELDGRRLLAGPPEVAIRLLGDAVRAVSGAKPHRPRLEQVEALWQAVAAALENKQRLKQTLGAALVAVDTAGDVRVTPAPERRSTVKRKTAKLKKPVQKASARGRSPKPT